MDFHSFCVMTLATCVLVSVTSDVVLAYDDALRLQMGMPAPESSSVETPSCDTEECQARMQRILAEKRNFVIVQSLNGILARLNMSEPPDVGAVFKNCVRGGGEPMQCAREMQQHKLSTTTTTSPPPTRTTKKPTRSVKVEPEKGEYFCFSFIFIKYTIRSLKNTAWLDNVAATYVNVKQKLGEFGFLNAVVFASAVMHF